MLQEHAERIARTLLGDPNERLSDNRELRYGNHGSLAIAIDGDRAGLWYDHENGEGGGMLDLIIREHGGTRDDAISWLGSEGININGQSDWRPDPDAQAARDEKKADKAYSILYVATRHYKQEELRPYVARYFTARGIKVVPKNAYFLPPNQTGLAACPYARIVFPIRNSKGIVGCHTIALNDTLDGKRDIDIPKRSFGPVKGGYIQLGRIDPKKPLDTPLIIAEGIETALSAAQLAGGLPAIATWGTSGMKSLVEIPACDDVLVARDRDKLGKDGKMSTAARDAAKALAGRLYVMNMDVRIVRPPKMAKGKDWNDVLLQLPNPVQAWERALEKAEVVEAPPEPLDWKRNFMVSAAKIQAMVDAKMALPGQIPHAQTLIYCAEPGAGKTTLCMCQAAQLVQLGYSVTYVNADIGMSEAKEADRLAREGGYDLLLPDFADSEHKSMDGIVERLADTAAADVVLDREVWFFDSLKKMNDMMHKQNSARLYKVFRRLTTKGMTLAIQAHTNKYLGPDGKPIYEGTSDLKSDNDNLCYLISVKNDDGSRTVSIEPDKVRAPLERLTFEISPDRQLKWLSEHVDTVELLRKQTQRSDDQPIIELITRCLKKRRAANESTLVKYCQNENQIGRRTTIKVLHRYVGELWDCSPQRENNARIYTLELR